MRWKRYQLKIDLTGITKKRVAEILSDYFQSSYSYESEKDCYTVMDNRERLWNVDTAKEIRPEKMRNDKRIGTNFFFRQD